MADAGNYNEIQRLSFDCQYVLAYPLRPVDCWAPWPEFETVGDIDRVDGFQIRSQASSVVGPWQWLGAPLAENRRDYQDMTYPDFWWNGPFICDELEREAGLPFATEPGAALRLPVRADKDEYAYPLYVWFLHGVVTTSLGIGDGPCACSVRSNAGVILPTAEGGGGSFNFTGNCTPGECINYPNCPQNGSEFISTASVSWTTSLLGESFYSRSFPLQSKVWQACITSYTWSMQDPSGGYRSGGGPWTFDDPDSPACYPHHLGNTGYDGGSGICCFCNGPRPLPWVAVQNANVLINAYSKDSVQIKEFEEAIDGDGNFSGWPVFYGDERDEPVPDQNA